MLITFINVKSVTGDDVLIAVKKITSMTRVDNITVINVIDELPYKVIDTLDEIKIKISMAE